MSRALAAAAILCAAAIGIAQRTASADAAEPPRLTEPAAERAIATARERWRASPHGPLLERTLPPAFKPAQLPEPDSRGAALVVQYCVQCHYLPNPAMHEAAKWPRVVDRMIGRIEGKGNYGSLMRTMMAGVDAPDSAERRVLIAYLVRNAQAPLDTARYGVALETPAGRSFRYACQQCHVLPDPERYRAAEWPQVVARMQSNIAWMNRVVGTRSDPREPQLRIDDINVFLAANARK